MLSPSLGALPGSLSLPLTPGRPARCRSVRAPLVAAAPQDRTGDLLPWDWMGLQGLRGPCWPPAGGPQGTCAGTSPWPLALDASASYTESPPGGCDDFIRGRHCLVCGRRLGAGMLRPEDPGTPGRSPRPAPPPCAQRRGVWRLGCQELPVHAGQPGLPQEEVQRRQAGGGRDVSGSLFWGSRGDRHVGVGWGPRLSLRRRAGGPGPGGAHGGLTVSQG